MFEGVHAVVESWYGGQEAGNGLADVLFGQYNPGGRLPLTFFDMSTPLTDMSDYDFAVSTGFKIIKEPTLRQQANYP